jgi:hypothetical protein
MCLANMWQGSTSNAGPSGASTPDASPSAPSGASRQSSRTPQKECGNMMAINWMHKEIQSRYSNPKGTD